MRKAWVTVIVAQTHSPSIQEAEKTRVSETKTRFFETIKTDKSPAGLMKGKERTQICNALEEELLLLTPEKRIVEEYYD